MNNMLLVVHHLRQDATHILRYQLLQKAVSAVGCKLNCLMTYFASV